MANLSTLSSGSSVVLTVTDQQSIVLNNGRSDVARLQITTGPGAGSVVTASHNGRRVYGPFGAGTITLSAVSGDVRYELSGDSTSPLDDDGQPLTATENQTVRALVSGGGNGNGIAETVLQKYGKTALDITLANVTPASATNMTWSRSAEKQRFGNMTVKISPTADTGCIMTFTGMAATCDIDDLLYSLDVFMVTQLSDNPAASPQVTITLSASAGLGSNYDQWIYDGSALRPGWNTLKQWSGDDTSGGYRGSNLGYGVTRNRTGTGFDFTQPLQYLGIRFSNLSGATFYVDQLRRAAKAQPKIVIGFDATGTGTADNVFTEKVAPMLASEGVPSPYFTTTWIYEGLYTGGTSWNRAIALYRDWGWDAINHTWNHGATIEGRRVTVTLARTSNVVTATFAAAHNITVGRQFKCKISGATPSDMNGTVWATATTTTAVTYSATGADGAGSGTIYLVTLLADVLDTVSTENQQLIDHEIIDVSRLMRACGLSRGAHLLAYPNNSVPELTQLDSACRRAGVVLGRGARGGSVNINEFGVDNPLHMGSWAFESSASLYSTQTMLKRKVQGAIGRGESLIFFGHFILDDAGVAVVDMDFPPGQGGNPAPPAAGVTNADGGWWYLSQLRQFVQWLKTQPLALMSYRQLADHVSAQAREGV